MEDFNEHEQGEILLDAFIRIITIERLLVEKKIVTNDELEAKIKETTAELVSLGLESQNKKND